MRRLAACILLLCVPLLSHAQDKKTITVLDFAASGVSEGEMRSVISLLSSALFQTGRYVVIDVAQRDKLLEEIEFAASDCTDESCQVEIGKLLAAEMVVVGSISRVGSKYVLATKMLDTESSRTESTADGIYADLDSLVEDTGSLARKLAGLPVEAGKKPAVARAKPSAKTIVGFGLLGGGAVVGGVGGVLTGLAVGYKNSTVDPAFETYDNATSDFDNLYQEYLDAFATYRGRLVAGLALAGGGAALIASGVVVLLLPAVPPKPAAGVSALLMPRRDGVTAMVRVSY